MQKYRLRLRLANKEQSDFSLDATTTFSHSSNYDTRSDFANQRVHLQWTGGGLRPFVAGDLRVAALNELNVLLGEFLPQPMRYLRGTITTGVAYVRDRSEIGVSIALARTRYEDEFDLFGFRRNNDRVQPMAYAKYQSGDLGVAGAFSFLRVQSQEAFFTDVNAILFEFSLAAKREPWSAELMLARTAEDTTFPVSPLTVDTGFQAKLVRSLDERTSVGVFGRVLHRKYWDSPFFSRTRIAGLEIAHDLVEDVRLTGEFGVAKSRLISGAKRTALPRCSRSPSASGSRRTNKYGRSTDRLARRNARDLRLILTAGCRGRDKEPPASCDGARGSAAAEDRAENAALARGEVGVHVEAVLAFHGAEHSAENAALACDDIYVGVDALVVTALAAGGGRCRGNQERGGRTKKDAFHPDYSYCR